MRILPISTIKGKLNEFVDAVSSTQDQITITKNGAPAAVLVGADEWESLQETLYWLAQPGIRESIAEADADIASGRTYGEDEIRAEFGVPRRPTERCLTPCGSPQPRVETSTSCHRESSRQWSNSRSAICRASPCGWASPFGASWPARSARVAERTACCTGLTTSTQR